MRESIEMAFFALTSAAQMPWQLLPSWKHSADSIYVHQRRGRTRSAERAIRRQQTGRQACCVIKTMIRPLSALYWPLTRWYYARCRASDVSVTAWGVAGLGRRRNRLGRLCWTLQLLLSQAKVKFWWKKKHSSSACLCVCFYCPAMLLLNAETDTSVVV